MLRFAERSIRYDRLITPPAHLGVLIEPSAETINAWLAAAPPAPAARLLGVPVDQLRASLRDRLGLRAPLVLTGHQPEFFHAGVLAKNFAARRLAARHGADVAFIAVDSDTPNSTFLRVPRVAGGATHIVQLDAPGCDTRAAYQHWPDQPLDRWVAFFAQAAATAPPEGDALLGAFARAWIDATRRGGAYVNCFEAALMAAEAATAVDPLPHRTISRVAETPEFRVFAAHLLLHAPDFASAYNAAQQRYRRRHHVRSAGRPVPPLETLDDAVESPFWLEQRGAPRQRLFVRSSPATVDLLSGRRIVMSVPRERFADADAHATPWPLAAAGWSIQPRALALSGFLRLCLADVFIHGIGGGKYDEITEEFAAEFFGSALPPACCVSATVRLPLPHSRFSVDDLRRLKRDARDVIHNPQRHVAGAPAEFVRRREELIRQSAALRADAPHERESRRLVHREIRRVNGKILDADPWRQSAYQQRIEVLERQLAQDRIARDREYFFGLHSIESMRALRDALFAALPIDGAPPTAGPTAREGARGE